MSIGNKFRIPSIRELYKVDFDNPSGFLEVGDFQVPLPKKPPLKMFKNYGIEPEGQFFYREEVPIDLKRWDKQLRDQFVEVMYHKRYNGEWWLIGGHEIYLTGQCWMFLNFWEKESGGRPDFRYECYEWFLFWEMCRRDPNCYGMLDVKARRLGDTEKTLFVIWETITRIRNSHGGMQNISEADAGTNFQRIVEGNRRMIWFFKPIMSGMEKPKKELEFGYPSDIFTAKKLKEKKRNEDAIDYSDMASLVPDLKGLIDFEATKEKKYDGQRLKIYHCDEPGKITEMNVEKQWGIIKPTLHIYNGKKIVGKALFTSTVEDLKEGDVNSLETMKKMWEMSNPKKRDGNGRTLTGLYRYFRSTILASEPDEFGFYDIEEATQYVRNTIKGLEEIGDFDGVASLKRKQPLSIEDVFALSYNECVLYPILLDARIYQIENNLSVFNTKTDENGETIRPKAVRGNLAWTKGFGSDVQWIPDEKGRWYISQMPKNPNARMSIGQFPKPANAEMYTMGCDPVDALLEGDVKKASHSNAAFAIYRRYDELEDGHLPKDDKGIVVPSERHRMKSAQFVCDYEYRPDDPHEFFDDAIMTCIFYGVPMMYEKDKPSIAAYFNAKGLKYYLKAKPLETQPEKIAAKKEKERRRLKQLKENQDTGAKASPSLIRLYVGCLKTQVYYYIQTFHHLRILKCHRQFNVVNRTERDLTVAAAFALLSDMDTGSSLVKEHTEQHDELWNIYKRNQ